MPRINCALTWISCFVGRSKKWRSGTFSLCLILEIFGSCLSVIIIIHPTQLWVYLVVTTKYNINARSFTITLLLYKHKSNHGLICVYKVILMAFYMIYDCLSYLWLHFSNLPNFVEILDSKIMGVFTIHTTRAKITNQDHFPLSKILRIVS